MPPRRTTALPAALAALVAVALLGACGGGDDGDASPPPTPLDPTRPVVVVKDLEFRPDDVRVPVGARVTWRFDDGGVAHNVVGDGFESDLEKKGTWDHTFDEAGTFHYRCTVHPSMKGTVVVGP